MRAPKGLVTTLEPPPIVHEQQPEPSRIQVVAQYLRKYRWVVAALMILLLALIPAILVYRSYSRTVARTLRTGPFANSSNIYSAPRVLTPGEEITEAIIVAGLERSGYSRSQSNKKGWYRATAGGIEVHPGPQSYFQPRPASIQWQKGLIARLVSLTNGAKLDRYELEPELIANFAGDGREKRRLVTFSELPPVLVHAVIATEDKRFFEHIGFDPLRLAKAAYIDARSNRKQQGASTITMQLARSLWLNPEKRWKRKFSELMITLVLEHRLSKQQIFQLYANQVYLGRADSFSIHGFGEAARAYFDKDVSQLNLPESALLAGMIQRPSYFNPERYPERAAERRNLVLRLMRDNGYITAAEYTAACSEPLRLSPRKVDRGDAPYFVALMNDELQDRMPDTDEVPGGQEVYSTLDPDLQRAAVEAIRTAMPKVDALVKARKIAKDGALPQVALIALDPHTGEVKALVGGRDYGASQLNHALSMRQPGSVFKPFVYAAALNTAIDHSGTVFTPASVVDDEPSTFQFGAETYEPSNFEKQFYGPVTLRTAMAKSLNVATVALAEQVGYGRVVNLARKCGLDNVQPTPAVALGSYDASPLQIAGAYTVFANGGEYVRPTFLAKVKGNGQVVISGTGERRRVLDPRIAFMIDDMMREVMRTGTGAGVYSYGFKQVAAGKTGTSRDGWFAGFTPDLLCVVWVGFDDNRELKLEGAKSALPVWAEFMKRASRYHPNAGKFPAPPRGVVSATVDPNTGMLASSECGPGQLEYFIADTVPTATCQDPFAMPGAAVTMSSSADPAPVRVASPAY